MTEEKEEYPMVSIVWEDAYTTEDEKIKDIRKEGPCYKHTPGFLLCKNKDLVKIITDLDLEPDGANNSSHGIPIDMIREIRYYKEIKRVKTKKGVLWK